MTRLTNDMREAIAHAAVWHKFDPLKKKLDDMEDTLAREAYAAIIPADELKALEGVPPRWLNHNSSVTVSAGGYNIQLSLKEGTQLPVPRNGAFRLGALPHGDLCDRARAHANAQETLRNERRNAFYATQTLLASVTTFKALRAAWPDGETFYKKFEGAVPASTLPAVQVAKVNEMLGLPPV